MKMWSGRIDAPIDSGFDRWQRSFPFDRRLLPYEVAASRAYAEALGAAGVLSEHEQAAILAALEELLAEGVPLDDDPTVEDVHHFVEERLVQRVGEAGYKLHTGRSRNDQIATDLRLYLRETCERMEAGIADLIEALLDRAGAAGETSMPLYTHVQRAEPVLVAHWLLAYVEMLFRDGGRIRSCRMRLNECPLGAGAGAGSIVPIDRAAIARRLGFDRPTANSIDASCDRDFAVEFVQCAALLAAHLSRLAEDLILFSSREFGFVHIADAYCTGSSAMPQKRNPDALELLRAHAARTAGNSVTLLACVKGLPLAYNRDLQETQIPLFDTADRSIPALEIAAGVVASLRFDPARMREAAGRGGLNALGGAAAMVRDGVPFRRAHERLGNAVRASISRGCELEDLSAAELRECGIDLPVEAFRSALRLDAVLDLHDVHGGTAPARVSEALASTRAALGAMREAARARA